MDKIRKYIHAFKELTKDSGNDSQVASMAFVLIENIENVLDDVEILTDDQIEAFAIAKNENTNFANKQAESYHEGLIDGATYVRDLSRIFNPILSIEEQNLMWIEANRLYNVKEHSQDGRNLQMKKFIINFK